MKNKNVKRFIYCLKRHPDGEIFYIGVTNDCKVRLIGHKSNFGKDIVMEVIEEVCSLDKSLEREKHWIQAYTRDGIILDNKSGFEITPTKSIKISNEAHRELKLFAATTGGNMVDIAGLAIMRYLKDNGHKFLKSKPSPSKP